MINGLEVGFDKMQTSKILEKCQVSEIKAIILHSVDDIDLSKLTNCFVIYIGTHGDKCAHITDVVLPSQVYSRERCFMLI